MRNTDLILDNALNYLYQNEEKLKPYLDKLNEIMTNGLNNGDISVKDAFVMYTSILEQYTNSVMLITKIQEIIDYKE